jgi:2-polyprenyl-6-hydroxyphenyl methylase/3-demethylubiquinone-9 3-methyltransferase
MVLLNQKDEALDQPDLELAYHATPSEGVRIVPDDDPIVPAQETVTFSFGKNWNDYVEGVDADDIAGAVRDIVAWLGEDGVRGKRIIDVGSGSGIHSLAFHRLGAESVHSFDYDQYSVGATAKLRERVGPPSNWIVEHGSALDVDYVRSLGTFDIVYSWGVLHHTGAMWQAIDNTSRLVAPGGLLWISLYAKGPRYAADLALKRKFNASGRLGKRVMISRRILKRMLRRVRHFQNPFAWNQRVGRGMNVYHDIIDWLGGLPYETATADEVVTFMRQRGFALERIEVKTDGACSKYVLSRL